MAHWSSMRRRVCRDLVLLVARMRSCPGARRVPMAWGIRVAQNRFVPWVARTAFEDGIQQVHGIRMEIPRPPDWGGGGEFHMALGTYEHAELHWLLRRLRPGDAFLDVGAHIGYFTLPVARRVGPRGHVIAVEPLPSSATLLRRNIAMNGFENVTVFEAAASDRDGQAILQVSAVSDMWSTLREGTLDGPATTIAVATRSLDGIIAELGWPSVAGLKMDVEGAEAEVLRGCAEVLRRNPDAFLLFEVSGGNEERIRASLQTLRALEERGYRFRRLLERGLSPSATADELVPLLRMRNWHDSLFNVVAELGDTSPTFK